MNWLEGGFTRARGNKRWAQLFRGMLQRISGDLRRNWWPPRYVLNRFFKWPYQRVRYGYSDRDGWSMDYHVARILCRYIPDMIEHSQGFKEVKRSGNWWVSCQSWEPNDPDYCDSDPEHWHELLREMQEGFCLQADDDSQVGVPFEEYRKVEDKIDRSWALLGEFGRGLWT